MILSDKDIRRYLRSRAIIIDPPPDESQIDTTTIDLRIGEPMVQTKPSERKSTKTFTGHKTPKG